MSVSRNVFFIATRKKLRFENYKLKMFPNARALLFNAFCNIHTCVIVRLRKKRAIINITLPSWRFAGAFHPKHDEEIDMPVRLLKSVMGVLCMHTLNTPENADNLPPCILLSVFCISLLKSAPSSPDRPAD